MDDKEKERLLGEPIHENDQVFLNHFLSDHKTRYNRTQSYLKAHPGVTEASAASSASRLLKNDNIQARIMQHFDDLRQIGLNDQLRDWIMKMVLFDETVFIDKDGLIDPQLVKEHAPAGYIKGQSSAIKYAIVEGKPVVIEKRYSYRPVGSERILEIVSKIEKLYTDSIQFNIKTVYLDDSDKELS